MAEHKDTVRKSVLKVPAEKHIDPLGGSPVTERNPKEMRVSTSPLPPLKPLSVTPPLPALAARPGFPGLASASSGMAETVLEEDTTMTDPLDEFGRKRKKGEEVEEPPELTLADLMREMRLGNRKLSSEFTAVKGDLVRFQQDLVEIKEHIQRLKAEFVSKPEFTNLEARVSVLETKGVPSEEVKSLRQQVSRLDLTNKSLRFRDFKDTDVPGRIRIIEHCLGHIGVKSSNVEHVYKWSSGQRELSDMCIVELGSNSVREQALKELNKQTIHDASDHEIVVERAKTANQLQRNFYLRKVSDALKKEPTSKDKPFFSMHALAR